MKIKPEHYQHMKLEIEKILPNLPEIKAAIQNAKDFNKRLRWDLSYKAKLTPYICDNIYSYADDSHIDTALKRIAKELEIA